MSKISILVVVALMTTSVSLDEQHVQTRLYRGQSQFSVSLLSALAKFHPGENLFFSPHSIYRTLLRSYIGSRGAIKVSLKEVLYLDWVRDDADMADAYKSEKIARATRMSGDNIHFSSSDKFYVPKDVMIPQTIREVFTFDEIKRMDFTDPEERRTDINDFVKKHTENKIDGMLPVNSVQNHRNVVLVNAALFKGFLKNRFDESSVLLQNFYGSSEQLVYMMSAVHMLKFGTLARENAEFIELPYEGDQEAISMFVFLPLNKKPNAIDSFLSKFSHESMQQALFNKNYKMVDVSMPKITFKGELLLKDALENMGLKRFFGTNFFDNIVHKTFAEINEKGIIADAAASTIDAFVPARGMQARSIGAPNLEQKFTEFHCNRPFVFTITDRVTQEVLFTGVYRGPDS